MNEETMQRNLRAYGRVGKNAIARFSAQVWAKLLALALVPLVIRYEGSMGLGRYLLVTSVVGIVGAMSDMGLKTFLMREVARTRDPAAQRRLLGHLLPLRLGLAAVGYVLVVVLTATPFFTEALRRLLLLGGLMLFPEGAMGAMDAFISGRRRMDISSVLQMVTHLLGVGGGVSALMLGFGVPGVLISMVVASAVGVLLYGRVLWHWDIRPRPCVNLPDWRAVLMQAYPFALIGLIAIAYARLDIVLLSAWQGASAAGWYGAAYKLGEAFGLIPSSLLDALFPELARLASAQEGRTRLRMLFHWGTPLLVLTGIVLSSVGTALADWLIPSLYGSGETYGPSVASFYILVWTVPATFLYLLSGHTLYALERQRRVTMAMFIVGVVNVTLNLLIIPRWSYLGVSGVALFSSWLLGVLLYIQAQRAMRGDEMRRGCELDTEGRDAGTDLSKALDYLYTARAFDVIAADYDAVYGPDGNAIMTWMRRENLKLLLATFPVNSYLLEIGCGTGEDAVALAQAGRHILATDVSPKMVARTKAKAQAVDLDSRVAGLAVPGGGLAALHPKVPFDGAYASFGALNCELDLDAMAISLAQLVKPGGYFVCSVMARWCPVEIVWFLLHGQPRVAFRRTRRGWQAAPVAGCDALEVSVPTRYLSVRDVTHIFAPHFVVEWTMALPLLFPPPYLDGLYRKWRVLFARVEPWECFLRERWPWRCWGDHIVLILRRL